MLDDVPVQVWILLCIAGTAYAPAAYVYRHVTADPNRRDVGAPAIDLSWRSQNLFVYCAALLVALAGLAIFIFTPAAERFARSPSFQPLMLAALGCFTLFTVAKSMATGTIEPFTRGFNRTYERALHPKRFWASAIWNALLGGIFMFASVATIRDQGRERCFNYNDRLSSQEQLSACDDLLDDPDLSRADRADVLRHRGFARHRLGRSDRAIDDYNRTLELDPGDSYVLYNRGLLYLEGEQYQFAIEDFSQSLKLRPDNIDAYEQRAAAYAGIGATSQAIADISRILHDKPGNETFLVWRANLQAQRGDFAAAERDLASVRAVNPSSLLLLRGEAFLSWAKKDPEVALEKLQAALAREPGHPWTLALMADVQQSLGQHEEAKATRAKLPARAQNGRR